MLSTAHIFYIPLLVLIGMFAGYYVGRYHVEMTRAQNEKRKKRGQRTNP